jgi:hypothetical protein
MHHQQQDCLSSWYVIDIQSHVSTRLLCTSPFHLQALVGSLSLPGNLLKSLTGTFQPGSLLICRSSANVEDLAGMSGAGLYESVPNVPSDRPEDISAAVAAVWASLYTRRAILSRRAAGESVLVYGGGVGCRTSVLLLATWHLLLTFNPAGLVSASYWDSASTNGVPSAVRFCLFVPAPARIRAK